MLWKKSDFEREVRRQLIELRALRKRVPPTAELLQHIERLEASHHALLRKMDAVFTARDSAGEEPSSPAGLEDAPVASSPGAAVPGETAGFERPAVSARCVSAAQLVLAPGKVQNCPAVEETCSSCGKVLVSSILAGAEVVRHGTAWYHAACVDGGSSFGKKGTLN
jgi:hypothetical protein